MTLWECPSHGILGREPRCYGGCSSTLRQVRVFREEDARSLWEAARSVDSLDDCPESAPWLDALTKLEETLAAFPAPEEWKR